MNIRLRSGVTVLLIIGGGVARGAADRIVRPVDNAQIKVIRGNLHPLAQARFDQGPADPGTALNYTTLLLKPAPGLEVLLQSQNTAGNANFRKWLQPEEFADRFGASPNDIAKLRTWLESQGLQVEDVARGRSWITFSGTAAQMAAAFHTEFHRYAVNGQMHVANATEPSVPEAFGDVVAGFRGLNDFRPKPPVHPGATAAVSPQYSSGGYNYLAPGDLATIYDISPLYNMGIAGQGQTIVVVGGSDIRLNDIATFRGYWALPVNAPQLKLFGPDPEKLRDPRRKRTWTWNGPAPSPRMPP